MLEQAVDALNQLRELLRSEVAHARSERQILRTRDARAIFARASERAAFVAQVARLEQQAAGALGLVARALQLDEVSLARLRQKVPSEAPGLARVLDDIQALAGALQEIDRLNLFLGNRALSCVRGYVTAVSPLPAAYDRRGAFAAPRHSAAVSVSIKG
jgi:hypothetical protein